MNLVESPHIQSTKMATGSDFPSSEMIYGHREVPIEIQGVRVRTLTYKAQELYIEKVHCFQDKLLSSWNIVQREMDQVVTRNNIEQLKQLEKTICCLFGEYKYISKDFTSYLQEIHTEDSLKLLGIHLEADKKYNSFVNAILSQMDIKIQNLELETRSVRSVRSSGSIRSSTSSAKTKAKIKAEAARARIELISKETALKKREIEIQGDLKTLKEEQNVINANVEGDTCETIDEWHENESERRHEFEGELIDKNNEGDKILQTPSNPDDRTKEYVNSITNMAQTGDMYDNYPSNEVRPLDQKYQYSLSPNAPVFESRAPQHGWEFTNEFSKILQRKELLFSRLTRFDDHPENFSVWKSTFKSVMLDLNINEREELDLLVKWLGADSVKHAVSIRSSSANNPAVGLRRIWERLEDRFGSPEMVDSALQRKLEHFPTLGNKDSHRLYELLDILDEVQSNMGDPNYKDLLSYFNTSRGIKPIVEKLPYSMIEKWTTRATRYKLDYAVSFPPFSYFTEFIREMCRVKNDPGFKYDTTKRDSGRSSQNRSRQPIRSNQDRAGRGPIASMKTGVSSSGNDRRPLSFCLLRNVNGHTLNSCRTFRNKPVVVRKKFLKDRGVCFKCCDQTDHYARDCQQSKACEICKGQHATALHIAPSKDGGESSVDNRDVSGKIKGNPISGSDDIIKTSCLQVCGTSNINNTGKSCAKIVCVQVYDKNRLDRKVKMYAIIDDQSNKSLVKPEFFDKFEKDFERVNYSLSSCAGKVDASGRRATGFVVESLDGAISHELPALTECLHIPDIRDEIPTNEVALAYPHLHDIAPFIPPLDDQAPIMLLLGRDITEAHHIVEQKLGPRGQPYAQKLSLGWVVVGEACLGKVHAPATISVNKTYIHPGNRLSIFPLCENHFVLKDQVESAIFTRTSDDDKMGMSVEDLEFIDMMDKHFVKSKEGNWSAPLPFRSNRPKLPNNKRQVLKRTNSLKVSLQKDPIKKGHFIEFMGRIFDNGYAELAPELKPEEECWYLPIFGVYHAKKKDQLRVVFDSSAQCKGLSLNSVLLQGPDLANNMLGVLMRFRKHPVAIIADIQQMFFQFRVHKKDRNYLRFIWFKDNDPDSELVEYRMCAHVFGNSPSPSIATYGLRKVVAEVESEYGKDVREFVDRNFYVDDGLASFPDSDTAIDVLSRTQKALELGGNLRLHKIASNDEKVMKSFSKDDLAKDLKDIALGEDTLPSQRSLGLNWNLNSDSFTFVISDEAKPLTRRGVLSTINSLYDPLGFIAPVVVQGRILMRDLIQETVNWDEPLSNETCREWIDWKDSLKCVENLSIPRTYLPLSLAHLEIHIFADASEKAISAVAYTRSIDDHGDVQVGFVLGKSKLAPRSGHTIPRLELCAALLAVEIAEIIVEHLDIPMSQIKFYTDSRVVLGYLNNKVRRFYIYVQNRVARILKSTSREQWFFVSTEDNPADEGTRMISSQQMQDSKWLNGPECLKLTESNGTSAISHELIFPEGDKEIRPEVRNMKTDLDEKERPGIVTRFERFSQWDILVRVIAVLHVVARRQWNKGNSQTVTLGDCGIRKEAERFIIKKVQSVSFSRELECLSSGCQLPKDSVIRQLDPFIDNFGLLRVGGRLRNSSVLSINEKHPVILPKGHHVSTLIIRFFHEKVKHQGYHLTEGATRSAGYWIIGVKRRVRTYVNRCVKCRKLRGKTNIQIMSDLPSDRVSPGSPFSSVGVDVFGHWNVISRRTRGGVAHNKRWAVIYTCLTTRAIHIEVIEELSTSSFINATRRFIALRGKVTEFRSDRGTNFVGATDLMNITTINVEDKQVISFLNDNEAIWIFNSPHSSHMGGVWERLIGVVRRILDSMLADLSKDLTHEVLSTLMAEICSIVNSRPLVNVSTDPENPMVLSPMMLLTHKSPEVGTRLKEINLKDMYKAQWRQVQCLSNIFWRKWKTEFLQTLQQRQKWESTKRDLKRGDVVLVQEDELARNDWPMGIVIDVYPSHDCHVRKVGVKLCRKGDDTCKVFTRPITKIVTLIECEDKCG